MKYLFLLLLMGCGSTDKKPEILVIGDSVAGGWTPLVAFKMPQYTWHRLTINQKSTWIENARNTTYTLQNVNKWLSWYPKTSIILWNNGIWNCSIGTTEDRSHYQTNPEQYENDIVQIGKILKSRASKVIFLTTTQMMNNQGCEIKNNETAKRVLPKLGIDILDLYSFTLPHPEWHLNSYDVHFGGLANEFISDWIAGKI